MKATITISETEIFTILRERALRLVGVDKVTDIKPILEYNPHDERSDYHGHAIEVELREVVK